MVKYTDSHSYHAFNPNAKAFIPRNKPANIMTDVVLAMLFLFLLLVMIIFSYNDNDVMNRKLTLRKGRNDNRNQIIIGHLNIISIRYKQEFLNKTYWS